MATLVFSAVGTLVGGPLGGAIGALVGRQVDSAIIGTGHRQGARLKELDATTSSYGAAIPRCFGRMRIAGTIIWATELAEHSETSRSSKSAPSVTNYSYTASFAVALTSRPIGGIGRIWADGNLLRGAAGDLKTGGTLRVYTGEHDQVPDPLIAAAEGSARCPAYRGLAYVVFEDLELADFYNRIPALTFEVFADAGDVSLKDIVGSIIEDVDAAVPLPGVAGFLCEGPLADTLQLLDPLFPMDCDANSERLTFARERLQDTPIALPEPARSVRDDDFGAASGFARKRAPAPANPTQILRYYDLDRDYLPSVQRALGQAGPGEPQTIELPAAMHATDARDLAERMARRENWSRETLSWRSAELDPRVVPGAIVTLPGQPGRWRVNQWEWLDTGVELALSRVVPTGADATMAAPVDPGRINPAIDAAATSTLLTAFELPWDGNGSADTVARFAAVSSSGSRWKGAALFADRGDGNLLPLGPSGRIRSVMGIVEGIPPPASPLLIDRNTAITVVLADQTMTLGNVDGPQLAQGDNRALIGREIIQFARAAPLGDGRWRLTTLLRGRGGSEAAIGDHAPGEPFVLLDGRGVTLDAAVGIMPGTTILAAGLGDTEPVASPIWLEGSSRRPLLPVHARVRPRADGGMELGWTRRSRGSLQWDDGIEVPLNEEAEVYLVTFGELAAPVATWSVTSNALLLPPASVASLKLALPGGKLSVRQVGTYALSDPLLLTTLT